MDKAILKSVDEQNITLELNGIIKEVARELNAIRKLLEEKSNENFSIWG